jgi:hypothetical protein
MLQTLLMMIMFVANLVQAAWTGHEEKRDLSLDADGVETLQVEAGAGSLDVTGAAGTRIGVNAFIRVPGADADEGQEITAEPPISRATSKTSTAGAIARPSTWRSASRRACS